MVPEVDLRRDAPAHIVGIPPVHPVFVLGVVDDGVLLSGGGLADIGVEGHAAFLAQVAQEGQFLSGGGVAPQGQGQKLRRVQALEELRQGPHPVPDAVAGEDGEVIRAEKKKDQLTLGRFQAVFGELVDAHELPGGQMPPQLLFLFSIQDQDSSHS